MLTRLYLRPSIDKPLEKDELTQFVVCGNYVCWRAPYELRVQIVNIKDMAESTRSPYDLGLPHSKKIINL